MVIGFLKFHTCFCLRRIGKFGTGAQARMKPTYTEYPRGEVMEIREGELPKRAEFFINEQVVDIFDKDMNPATWEQIKALYTVWQSDKKTKKPNDYKKAVQKIKAE